MTPACAAVPRAALQRAARRHAPLPRAALICAALACATLFGCTSAPPVDGSSAVEDAVALPPAAPAPQSLYESQQRERALAFVRQRRLADAAITWELLTVLRPDAAEYRDRLADVQRQIDAAVAERLPRAAQAAQRGEIDNATQLYLAILALQPLDEPAAEALRSLERERNKRHHLGKFSHSTLTRRSLAEAEVPTSVGSGGLAGRSDIEHAALLAGDGEFDDAIGLLERRLVLDPKDSAARRLLADVHCRKAEAAPPRGRPGATLPSKKGAGGCAAEPRAAVRPRQPPGSAVVPVAGTASAARGAAVPAR